MAEVFAGWIADLQDEKHLNRQRGLKLLAVELKKNTPTNETLSYLIEQDQELMGSSSWESLQSAFLLAAELLKYSTDNVSCYKSRCSSCLPVI